MNKNDSFSVRMGIVPVQVAQTDELNQSTRLAIYHFIDTFFSEPNSKYPNIYVKEAWISISRDFFSLDHKLVFDSYHGLSTEFIQQFRHLFLKGEWYNIFDLVEYIFIHLRAMLGIPEGIKYNSDEKYRYEAVSGAYHDTINFIMKNENVGYKLLEGKFIPLTNEKELEEVSRATTTPYKNANNHIVKAIGLFSDRENFDYANTIKESILAVEAAVKELVDDDNATLGAALAKLEKSGVAIHPAFKAALSQLYGFTSDAAGIRHGGKGDPIQQDQATARFMLVTCSAFVNYLIANSPTGDK